MTEREFDESDGTLGPCGCTDYHMADCPIRTEQFSSGYEPDEPDWGREPDA